MVESSKDQYATISSLFQLERHLCSSKSLLRSQMLLLLLLLPPVDLRLLLCLHRRVKRAGQSAGLLRATGLTS